jgi:hypothetical protein
LIFSLEASRSLSDHSTRALRATGGADSIDTGFYYRNRFFTTDDEVDTVDRGTGIDTVRYEKGLDKINSNLAPVASAVRSSLSHLRLGAAFGVEPEHPVDPLGLQLRRYVGQHEPFEFTDAAPLRCVKRG